jgi:NADPH:quinone reductase-like Zn-dependent oxidoreductase
MFAVVFNEYGGPEVLLLGEVPEPHAGEGQVRVRVRATSVNPFDWKLRAGYMAEFFPLEFPAIPGVDGAGVVDEVGDGVTGYAVGDEVFGLGSRTSAEFAVLDMLTRKPAAMTWEEAGSAGLAFEAATRALNMLHVGPGTTLLIDGAAGGTGSAAVQLAVVRGATVIGTASEANHDSLARLGAIPTTYGPGLAKRVAELAPAGVTTVLDAAGQDSIPDLVAIAPSPDQVVSLGDFGAGQYGARVVDGSIARAPEALEEVARLYDAGNLTIPIGRTFPLKALAQAHQLSQEGHVRGKIAITVD